MRSSGWSAQRSGAFSAWNDRDWDWASPTCLPNWQITGNLIVMNEGLVEAMRTHAKNPLEFNSFLYVILAHEYLHSLGYLDERAVREVTARVTRTAFGPDHPATRMAEGDLWRMFPFLANARGGRGSHLRVVPRFDLQSTDTYIR
ncbi:MAG: hypothetical protein L3K02_08970 [Thermoplasmata archaeon]|nr:hypothetical protein [Thermoplasmata archaeon]